MTKCIFCNEETILYVSGQPFCAKCDTERDLDTQELFEKLVKREIDQQRKRAALSGALQ